MNRNTLTTLVVLIVLFLGLGYWLRHGPAKNNPQPTSQNQVPADWKTGVSGGATFRYPESLGTKYIALHEWPPTVEVKIAQFSCAEPVRQINGRGYCIGKQTGAAAGSTYTTYTYNTMKNGRMVSIRFTLRYPQCANYVEPQKTECEQEREAFNIDLVVDKIVQSVRFT